MTRFGVSEDILGKISGVMAKFHGVRKAVIYGSRARGDFKNQSDIDIAVYAPGMSHADFLALLSALDDLPVIFQIQAVHFDTLENNGIKGKIERDGVEFYASRRLQAQV
ncbi:MAG: nucleotidyltransferase domain-containing protein [Nitrospinae bacterium]|nr:nucleotidyltransferase domain-containing protein [Nitrospinota bacterium]